MFKDYKITSYCFEERYIAPIKLLTGKQRRNERRALKRKRY